MASTFFGDSFDLIIIRIFNEIVFVYNSCSIFFKFNNYIFVFFWIYYLYINYLALLCYSFVRDSRYCQCLRTDFVIFHYTDIVSDVSCVTAAYIIRCVEN